MEEAYSAHLSTGVISGRLDFALVPSAQSITGLHAAHLASDVEVFVTAPNPQREHLSPIDLTRIDPLKIILPGPGNVRRTKIEEYIQMFNIPIKKILELDTMMATLDLVARSDWSAILPGCLVIERYRIGQTFLTSN